MATLISRVRAITKSTATISPDADVVASLQDVFSTLLNFLPHEIVWNITTKGTIATNAGFSLDSGSNRILSVFRNGYPAQPVQQDQIPFVKTSGNVLYPSNIFPKYFIENNKVFVKPDPTDVAETEEAEVYYLKISTLISVITTSAATCGIYSLDEILVMYTAVKDFMSVGSYWRTQGESQLSNYDVDISSALTSFEAAIVDAEAYMDGSVTTNNIQDYIDDDDAEMVASELGAVNAEFTKAKEYLQEAEILLGKNSNIATYFNNYISSMQAATNLYQQATDRLMLLMKNYMTQPKQETKAQG